MALFLSVFPVLLLIWMMIKKNAVPSYIALPATAALILLIQWQYFGHSFPLLSANVGAGLVATLTPITVIFGAIFFNRMMEATGCIGVIRQWLGSISPNPVAQLMIIGWAFAFMIEGASGFGTPAAIAAPILVGLGFAPMKVAVFALVMNSVPVSFGAVGTPTWFGFGPLKLSDADILSIGQQTALIHFIAGFIIPVMALRLITSWDAIRKNIVFIYLSILSCTIPYVLLAQVNYEFPSLVGGGIGLLLSVLIANKGIGLARSDDEERAEKLPVGTVLKALAPMGMLMFILIITRIQQFGLKAMLNDVTPLFSISLGLFDFEVSRALILGFNNILGQGVNESYKTLYVPAFIPFVITVWLSLLCFRSSMKESFNVYTTTLGQTMKPLMALLGALAMVKLMLVGGDGSMVKIIGREFAAVAGQHWIYLASYMGAIGAFFSGSNTVANLTFGGIQQQIANATSLPHTTVLAAHSAGGAMGNMVCINNIIAVCSVLNVQNQEGSIIKQTAIPMFTYGIIVAIVAGVFLL